MVTHFAVSVLLIVASSKHEPAAQRRNALHQSATQTTAVDLTNASEAQLRRHVGELVRVRGKFSLRGKFAPFVLVRSRPIYIETRTNSYEPYEKMEGLYVTVTGVLRFASSPTPPSQVHLPEARVSDHFFFEAETIKIKSELKRIRRKSG